MFKQQAANAAPTAATGSSWMDMASNMMSDLMSNAFVIILFILIIVIALLCACSGSSGMRSILGGGEEVDNGDADVTGGAFGNARLGIREPWFSEMLAGKKRVEGRLKRGAAATLKIGDTITIARSRPPGDTTEHPGARRYDTKVVRVTPYRSFTELVKKEGVSTLFPGKKDEKEAMEIYRQHSSEADEAEIVSSGTDGHAVVAIEVAPLSAEEQKSLKSFKPAHKAHAKTKAGEQYAW
jgi:ASC-1-like (ASCH) protein